MRISAGEKSRLTAASAPIEKDVRERRVVLCADRWKVSAKKYRRVDNFNTQGII